MGSRLSLVAVLACVLGLVSTASGASTPGVTSNSILIGGTTPLSGPASAYASVAKGADAYFKYIDARGGVFGRMIKYKYVDDGYDPSRTVEQTRSLVQQDHVFAIFNSLGTDQNLAVRSYLNQLGVPQLFVASGASAWGKDSKKYPWTIGYQPNYTAEGVIYGRYVAAAKPRAKIGVLYQNDDYGKELLAGLKRGLGQKAKLLVSKQGYDVTDNDVRSQVARLKGSGASVFMIFATPKFAIQAYSYARQLGWKPLPIVNAVSSATNIMTLATLSSSKAETNGSISIIFLKVPNDPRYARDPGVLLYRAVMRKYAKGSDLNDIYNVYGMSAAYSMVDALRKAGKNLTRAGIRDAVNHLNEPHDPFVLPGMVIRTTPANRFPIAQAKLERYENGRWVGFGPLVTVR